MLHNQGGNTQKLKRDTLFHFIISTDNICLYELIILKVLVHTAYMYMFICSKISP